MCSPRLHAELADGFDKRQAFDVAHRAAYFNENDVRSVVLSHLAYIFLDGTGDMRHNLNGAAIKIAAPFPVDQIGIHPAGADGVFAG